MKKLLRFLEKEIKECEASFDLKTAELEAEAERQDDELLNDTEYQAMYNYDEGFLDALRLVKRYIDKGVL